MKKILTTLALAALSIISVYALPADPTPRTIRQKDGSTVTLVLHGDEHHHWYTNLSGQRYALGTDGIFRPVAATKASVSGSGKRRMTKGANKASITKGNKKFLVVLIEFQDVAFSTDKAEFEKMLNQEGYSENGATGSVRDYYYENSSGQFSPSWDVIGPVKVSGNMEDYGGNDGDGDDVNPDGLLAEACDSIYVKGLANFADYDNDGDGVVENIYYFYAGYGEAVSGSDPNTIWPHSYGLYGSKQRTYDGKKIVSYACGPEFKGLEGGRRDNIGTFCHEFGHVLGLPDFYDIDYEEDGQGEGLGVFSLMDSGCYNNDSRTPPLLNAEERVMLGWMDSSAIKEITSPGNYTLQPISNNVAYKTPTGNDGEYYLYESRTSSNKWDAGAKMSSSDAGMNGLLVYRVDKSSNIVKGQTAKSRWENWKINNIANHQCFTIVAAKPSPRLVSDYFFGVDGRTEFSDLSNPRSENWAGKATNYNLSSIAISGGNSTFVLSYNPERKVLGTVTDFNGNPISGAAVAVSVVSASSAARTKAGIGTIARSPLGYKKAAKYNVTTDEDGEYSVELADGDAEEFHIVITKDDYKPFSKEFTLSSGRIRIDAVLIGVDEKIEADLYKYGELGERVGVLGYGILTDDVEAAVMFSADELSRYAGMRVSEIAFLFYGTSASQVDAIIESGGKRRLTHKVASPGYTEEYIEWTVADVKNYGYVIPSGEDVYFGYALKQIVTDNGYPLVFNEAEEANDGYVYHGYSTTAASWSLFGYYDEDEAVHYGNPIIAVRLVEDVGPFDEGKVIIIVSPSAGASYKAGANFDFKLMYGDIEDPTSVVWYYDGAQQSATSVNLTSGRHEVKAVCTFADGSTEEIIQIIKVQ